MNVTRAELPGILIIEPDVFSDARGSFFELWRAERFAEAGLDLTFVQDNISRSVRGTVRGMHFQHPEPQGKLVTVLHGEVFDVVADVRAGSPTFGKWWGTCLAASRPRQLYVPPGFAHGFQALSDEALFAYKCTAPFRREYDRAVRWDDPDLAIAWPLAVEHISDRDRHASRLSELLSECLPAY